MLELPRGGLVGPRGQPLVPCQVPGCGALQDPRFMGEVIVVTGEPGAYEVGAVAACSNHVQAFGELLPTLKHILERVYAGEKAELPAEIQEETAQSEARDG